MNGIHFLTGTSNEQHMKEDLEVIQNNETFQLTIKEFESINQMLN